MSRVPVLAGFAAGLATAGALAFVFWSLGWALSAVTWLAVMIGLLVRAHYVEHHRPTGTNPTEGMFALGLWPLSLVCIAYFWAEWVAEGRPTERR